MVINFICRASKANKEGLSPLELSIIINSERKVITLDRKLKSSTFNSKKQKARKNKEVNEYIEAVRAKIYCQEIEMLKRGIEINLLNFIDIFKHGFKSNSITLLQLFKQHFTTIEKKIQVGQVTATTLNKYKVTMSYLEKYLKTLNKSDILIKDITSAFADGFFTYLLNFMSNNTAVQKMKNLKTILLLAIDEGYIQAMPFRSVYKKEKIEVTPLTVNELKKIQAKKISCIRLDKVRDLFLFESNTGLAFSDMATLTADNFITDNNGNEWIIKDRQKTDVTSYIPLLPVAKKIWNKYDGKLPLLSNQKYNTYLKELGDICGINKELHSHLARHTFATILLNKGIDMVSLSKMLGHSSIRITERVYAKMLPSTIMNKIKQIEFL